MTYGCCNNDIQLDEQGRLTPHYGWEINPTSDTVKHNSPFWAERGGMILLFGPA